MKLLTISTFQNLILLDNWNDGPYIFQTFAGNDYLIARFCWYKWFFYKWKWMKLLFSHEKAQMPMFQKLVPLDYKRSNNKFRFYVGNNCFVGKFW